VKNRSPQRRVPGADDLRDGAVQIVRAHAIHAPQIPEQLVSGCCRMRRRDADDRSPGDDEHHHKIREPWHGASRDLLNGFPCGAAVSGRDHKRNRSNPLVHGCPTSTPTGCVAHHEDMQATCA